MSLREMHEQQKQSSPREQREPHMTKVTCFRPL